MAEVLFPVKVDDTVLFSSTVPEDSTAPWAPGAYNLGEQRHRVQTHRVYVRINAGNSALPPESDPLNWQDLRPTNRWAMFDGLIDTKTEAPESFTVVLRLGFFGAFSIFGVDATQVHAVVRTKPGGRVVRDEVFDMETSQPGDAWEYYFGGFQALTDLSVTDLVPYSQAELTLTVTNTGGIARVGWFSAGGIRYLGEAEFDASSELNSYSYEKTDEFGNTVIKRRRSSRNISGNIVIQIGNAPFVEDTLEQVRDITCVWILTNLPNFKGLRTVGRGSGRISYPNPREAILALTVKGNT